MGMKIVAVTFDSADGYTGRSSQSKHYHYKTDLDLQVGDQCVVDSPYGTKLVTVRSLEPVGGIRNATKWIISKVDRARFEARKQIEGQLADAQLQLDLALETALIKEQRRKLAERYPEVASLVELVSGLETALAAIS